MPKVPAFFVHAGVSSLDCIGVHPIRPAAIINAIGQGETRFGTTQGGTPTSLTFNRISQFQGSIKRAGNPCGNLTGGSVTYSNNLDKIETIRDDGLIEGADPTIAALTGRIDLRFADTTLIDLAAGGTPVDLEFAYTLSAQAKLVLSAHEVYLGGAGGSRHYFAAGVRASRQPRCSGSGTWRSIARSSELAAWRTATEREKAVERAASILCTLCAGRRFPVEGASTQSAGAGRRAVRQTPNQPQSEQISGGPLSTRRMRSACRETPILTNTRLR
jgi:hypothetical protein